MRIVVPLTDAGADALRRLASRELRDPRMQAKLLLEEALRQRCSLLDQPAGALNHAGTDHDALAPAGALPAEDLAEGRTPSSERAELVDA
jgi:hypothetical protein